MLFGGAGNDKFIFNQGSGNDIILDFTKGDDKIDIDPSIYGDVSDILSNITYQNNYAQISLGGGNNIFVLGATPNNPLTKDDFVQYTTIDFEDLGSTSFGVDLPNGYQGFNWILDDGSNAHHQNDTAAGYGVMGTNLIYNAFASDTVTISRVDGSSFDFEGVDLISAILPNQQIDVLGYLGGTLVETETYSLTNAAVTEIDVEWGEIDTLVLKPQTVGDNHFAMDNFDFVI